MIKLVVSDLDGTLVADDYLALNPRINDLILELKQKGIVFVAASGRQYPSMEKLFKTVKDEVIFVAENGAYVVCRDVEIDEHSIDKALTTNLIQEIRQLEDCFLTVSIKNSLYIETKNEFFTDLLLNEYEYEVAVVDDIISQDLKIIKISIYKKDGVEKLAKSMIPKWQDKFRVSVAGKCWLDFMDIRVDKGAAIAKIQELLSIGIDETMVFGDNMNDLGMFNRAIETYAVGNARQEVRLAAKHIIDTNLNYGVIKVLETLV